MSENTTQESRQIVEAMYAAAARGDFEGFMSHFDENIVVYEPPSLPFGGIYKGRDELMKLMGLISEHVDASTLKVQYLVAEGNKVFTVLSFNDLKEGKLLTAVEEATLRNGKVVEQRLFFHDAGSLVGGC